MRSTWARCLWARRLRTSRSSSTPALPTSGCPLSSARITRSRPRASGRQSMIPARAVPSRTAPTPAMAATCSSPTAPAWVSSNSQVLSCPLLQSWLSSMPPLHRSALVLCRSFVALHRVLSSLLSAHLSFAVFGNLINDTCLWGGLTISPQTFGIASSEPGQGECGLRFSAAAERRSHATDTFKGTPAVDLSCPTDLPLVSALASQPSTTATSTASWAWPSPSSPCPSAACCPGPSTTSWR